MLASIVGVIGAGLLSVIGWAFHVNSRVAVLEADRGGLREVINLQLQEINRRLTRIEAKLDHEEVD